MRARLRENSKTLTQGDLTIFETFQQETYWDVVLEHEIISISRTSKFETSALESRNLQQIGWNLQASILTCNTLIGFQTVSTHENFASLSRAIVGENWRTVSVELCANGVSAAFEALIESQSDTYGQATDLRTEVFNINFNGDKFLVKGTPGEFWEASVPDISLSPSELREYLQSLDPEVGSKDVLQALMSLNALQVSDLVKKLRDSYLASNSVERDFVCGTDMMNREPPRLRDLLLPRKWRTK